MQSYQPDEVIFRRGDPSDCAYLIEAGHVEVLAEDSSRPIHIALLGQGDIVGEMALIDERPRSLTARAVGEVSLSTVSREQFVKLMFNDPAEGLRYLRAFFERLRIMNARLSRLDFPGLDSPGLDSPVVKQTAAPCTSRRIKLIPLTVMSELALPAEGRVIEHFPLRVGRESPKGKSRLSVNDVGLTDTEPFNVSREHFAIDREGDALVVYDRGSYLGTIVNGSQIGGHRKAGSAPLRAGTNEIIAGSKDSPFRFSVVTDED